MGNQHTSSDAVVVKFQVRPCRRPLRLVIGREMLVAPATTSAPQFGGGNRLAQPSIEPSGSAVPGLRCNGRAVLLISPALTHRSCTSATEAG